MFQILRNDDFWLMYFHIGDAKIQDLNRNNFFLNQQANNVSNVNLDLNVETFLKLLEQHDQPSLLKSTCDKNKLKDLPNKSPLENEEEIFLFNIQV